MRPDCPDCDRPFNGRQCRCGYRPPAPRPAAAAPPRHCPADGAGLAPDGYCPAGAGYAATYRCPHVCPLCRHPLSWDGGCPACHGTADGRREHWTFPGPRYALVDSHWRRDVEAPPGRRAGPARHTTRHVAR